MKVMRLGGEIMREYEKWVISNPNTLSELESAIKYVSYIFCSRFDNSNIISELIYSLSKLLVFYNDQIIYNAAPNKSYNPYGSKLKKWLTVLGHCEVFIELSGQKNWGTTGKWVVIFIVQTFKCIIRLYLLLYSKEQIVETHPIYPLDRKNVQKSMSNNISLGNGRIIKITKVASFTQKCDRTMPGSTRCEITDKPLNRHQVNAEIIYVLKPLLHLGSMYYYGTKSWKPWLLAFALDVTSLRLMSKINVNEKQYFSERQRNEIIRRTISLVLYLLRTPFYDRKTKLYILSVLTNISQLPILGIFFKSLNEYVPLWQQTYFYLWSS